ncbi:MAG: cell wall hydrolase [Sphingomonas bacterium]|nr:cell wall hydrolase [Sphingomonas bacterium]
MFKRSLVGLPILLLGASCVPPQGLIADGTPHAGIAQPPMMAPRVLAGLADPSPQLLESATTTLDKTPVAGSAAAPFVSVAQGNDAGRALDCLTAAVYYEARSEPIDGQRAVAQVVLNRVRNPAFPASVCGVVYQGSTRSTGCQFTFTCDGSLLFRREPEAWERARGVAANALAGDVYAPVGAATYYHTTAVSPWWARSYARVATIGAHIFYSLGNALAFRQQYAGVEPGIPSVTGSGSGFGAEQLPGLVNYRMDDGSTVAVHRSGDDVKIAASRSIGGFGVRLHVGGGSSVSDDSRSSVAGVTVHSGTSADIANPA